MNPHDVSACILMSAGQGFETILAPLGRFWSRFGAHWILKRSPNRFFLLKNKEEENAVQEEGLTKTLLFDLYLMPK